MEQNQPLFLVYHFHDFIFILLNLYFWPACGILGPRPGIEPTPTSLEAGSLNRWTTRKVPYHRFLIAEPTSFPGSLCLPSSRTTPHEEATTPRGGPVLWLGRKQPCSTRGLGTSFPSLHLQGGRFCFEFHLQSWLLVEKPSP